MALPSDARLGPYEMAALICAGGMGGVYRARADPARRGAEGDRPGYALDAERLARFRP